ncbi:MAG TPA: TMEM43 family protein [Rhabdaerophilum sp.]|nr:TMEM43 family protein [Rhabdaerophilum sp.]
MSDDNDYSQFGLDNSGDQTFSAPDGGEDVHAAPQGFFERLSNSFGSIVAGLIMIPLACWGLAWNEGRAVKTARALTEGQSIVQAIGTDRVDRALDGKLIHVSGEVKSAGGVADPLFGVRTSGLKLIRHVEQYQWVEKESGSGQDRKFTYSREWRDRPVDSSRFKFPQGHQNPGNFNIRSENFAARDAKIGAYPVGLAAQSLTDSSEFTVNSSGLDAVRRANFGPAQIYNGGYYIGGNPNNPQIGHYRVTFRLVPEGKASFVGKQTPDGIEAYRAKNGREFLLAQSGTKTTDEMFEKAQDDNATLTWILRGVGLLVLFIGFSALFAPVTLLASYIPILGSLVSGAVGLVAGAATAIVGTGVIAIAWFAYRPVVSLVVLAIGAAVAFGLRQLRLRRQAGLAQRPA